MRRPQPSSPRWPPKLRRNGMSIHTIVLWPDDRRAIEVLHQHLAPEIARERLPLSALVRLAIRHEATRRERDSRRAPPRPGRDAVRGDAVVTCCHGFIGQCPHGCDCPDPEAVLPPPGPAPRCAGRPATATGRARAAAGGALLVGIVVHPGTFRRLDKDGVQQLAELLVCSSTWNAERLRDELDAQLEQLEPDPETVGGPGREPEPRV